MNQAIDIIVKTLRQELNDDSTVNWDVYVVTEKNRHISYRCNAVEDLKDSVETGYALRILKGHKISMVYGTAVNESAVRQDVARCRKLLDYMTPDEHFQMLKTLPPVQYHMPDNSFETLAVKDKIDRLSRLESEIFKQDRRITKIEHLGYNEAVIDVEYQLKDSDCSRQHFVYYGYDGEVIAEDGDEAEAGSYGAYQARYDAIDIPVLGATIADQALSLLNATTLQSGRYPVLMTNQVVAMFIASFISLFSAEEVYNNRSVLKGHQGERLFSPVLTLTDDATLDDELGSYGMDGEGVPGQRTLLVEKGVLHDFLYDLKSAHREDRPSTGNGLRSSYQGGPVIRPSNVVITPGTVNQEDLIRELNDGLMINGVMGMHTVNRVNGDFSVGATGYSVRRGEKSTPVKQFTLAGNFVTLMNEIRQLGNDVENFPFKGNIITPSILFSELSVSGV